MLIKQPSSGYSTFVATSALMIRVDSTYVLKEIPASIERLLQEPLYLNLSKEFLGGDDSVLDVKVKMIYDGKEGDMAGLVALFFGLFWDNNAFHKSDTYYEKSCLVSWGKEKNHMLPLLNSR